MALLSGVRRRVHAAGKFLKTHGETIAKGLVGAAAVATAVHGALSHSAREASSQQRYNDNVGNMEWLSRQPMERIPHSDTSRYGSGGLGPPPSSIVPVKY